MSFDEFHWTRRMSIVAILFALSVVGVGAQKLFLLFCPTRMWSVLRLTIEPSVDWTQPYQVALVAENAVENSGTVGTWIGRRLYARTVAPPAYVRYPEQPAYGAVHLSIPWLRTEGVSWETKPFGPHRVLVKVYVRARIVLPNVGADKCIGLAPTDTTVERDYVVDATPLGWRIAHVYMPSEEKDMTLMTPAPGLTRVFGCPST